MKILDPGHRYLLFSLDDKNHFGPHVLQFVKRVGPNYPENEPPVWAGTTSQETMRALIDRGAYLNKQIPCWQTSLSNRLLKICVWLYEWRAAKRHGRRIPGIAKAVYGEFCEKCGHVGCSGICHV